MTEQHESPMRAFARLLRHGPDRLLHPVRRRAARRRLAGVRPSSVVFVCLGNINRSAYAEQLLKLEASRCGIPLEVASAGFIGPGRPASEHARRLAQLRGLDLSSHVSRVLAGVDLRPDSLVVVMSAEQERRVRRALPRWRGPVIVLGDLDPDPIDKRLIQDPYGHSQEVFMRVFDRIDRCVQALAGALFEPR